MTTRKRRSPRRTSRKLRSNKHTAKSRRTSRKLMALFGAPASFARRATSKKRKSSKTKRAVRKTSRTKRVVRKSSKRVVRKSSKRVVRKSSKRVVRKSLKRVVRRRTSKGRWVIIVRGKAMPKKFRSSSALRVYASAKYGKRGFKYAWKAA